MLTHAALRLLQLVLMLLVLSLVTFILMKLAPGDPVLTILKAHEGAVTEEDTLLVREQLGFDLPLYQQYGQWLSGVVKLDLGQSYTSNRDVWNLLVERLPASIMLMAGSITALLILALPLGMLAAKYQNRLPDYISRLFALIGSSIPSFWLGLLLIYLFSYQLNWLPMMGGGSISHLILPSVTLGFVMAPEYIRLLRAGMLDTLSQEYIRAARARGIKEWSVLTRHALRAALMPVVSLMGMSMGALMAGSVVTESLFGWPGLGSMAMEAITQRNYPVIQGYILLTGLFIGLANWLSDMGLVILDPRIRLGGGRGG
ncbi:ABC transporter permease [Paenibacillus sp. 1011MAR3C5]|uniref:nickel ABC transporter permease n=1 Tax=Paenibacillus sp. 1011MAR3C5 TaxID=1675787 RepID=UPI000E6D4DBD|nr:nickel ABC transporter permease [Paenibacillus sp. 1011MAR3C5]RJE87019.1 ABC transporter permease [Paenibacillus sp. 1011MAR3C5]